MNEAINHVVENARILKAFAENHPAAAQIACTVHCPDDEPPSIAFLNDDRNDVMLAFGGGWELRSHRTGIDAHKRVDGVRLVIRDFTLTGTLRLLPV